MKIVWLSANLFGYELLKEAVKVKNANIVGIITHDEKSKMKVYDKIELKKWYEFNIPIFKLKDINSSLKIFKKLGPDIIIMAGWRQIINKNILNFPKKGFIGFHPTLLPKGRGSAPIINTIIEGYNNSGVTMYYVNDILDGGDIIAQKKFKVGEEDYSKDVYRKVIKSGKYLIKKYLPKLIFNNAPRIIQNKKKITYFKKRNLKDNEIDLKDSAEKIYKKIRALSSPYDGAFVRLNKKKLIIWKAELKDDKK